MDDLLTSKDKIQKICNILKNEAIDPAKSEVEKILQEARNQAQKIIHDAEKKAAALNESVQEELVVQKKISVNQLNQAVQQAKQRLREEVESRFFATSLKDLLDRPFQDPKLGASLVEVLIKAIDKEGISSDFSIALSENISKEQFVKALASNALERVKKEGITIEAFRGGVRVVLRDKKITLDLSEEALCELLGSLLRKDFRDLLFLETPS